MSAADAVQYGARLDSCTPPSVYFTPGGKYVLLKSISVVAAWLRQFYVAPHFNTFASALQAVVATHRLAARSDLLDMAAADRPKIVIFGDCGSAGMQQFGGRGCLAAKRLIRSRSIPSGYFRSRLTTGATWQGLHPGAKSLKIAYFSAHSSGVPP